MARIKGVEIPNNKKIVVSLTYVYGVGRTTAKKILEAVNIDGNKKTKDLTNEELGLIREELNKYTTEGDLRREVTMNIKNLKEMGCYRGMRHRMSPQIPLPSLCRQPAALLHPWAQSFRRPSGRLGRRR